MFSRSSARPPVQDTPPRQGMRPGGAPIGLPSGPSSRSQPPSGPGNYRSQGPQGPGARPGLSSGMGSGGRGPDYGARPPPSRPGPGGYPSSNNNMDRGGYRRPDPEDARNELFRGARQPAESYGNYDNNQGYDQGQDNQYDDEEEEVEAIKKQITELHLDTRDTSRRALTNAKRAEETAMNTLNMLTDQGSRLHNINHQLDMGDLNASRSEDTTKEIKALNRSIFRPNFTMNKSKKREAQEQKVVERHLAEREGRERLRQAQSDGRSRFQETVRGGPGAGGAGAGGPQPGGLLNRLASKYDFESTAEDRAAMQETDENEAQITQTVSTLHRIAQAMGNELTSQNQLMDTAMKKTDNLNTRVFTQTERLSRIK